MFSLTVSLLHSTASVSLVEPLELERHLHRLLTHLLQLSTLSPAVAAHFANADTLCALWKVLYPSAQRLWASGELLFQHAMLSRAVLNTAFVRSRWRREGAVTSLPSSGSAYAGVTVRGRPSSHRHNRPTDGTQTL